MRELIEEALELLRQSRPEEAASRLRRVLLADPENFEALHYMGVALGQQGLLEEAEGFLKRALAVRPDHALARYHLGYVLYRRGSIGEAKCNLEEALRLNPSLEEARRLLSEIGGQEVLLNLANFWARAVSAAIDHVVHLLLSLPILLPIVVPAISGAAREANSLLLRLEISPLPLFCANFALFSLSLLVYAIPWALWGRTPGMLATGLKLVDLRGRKPSPWRGVVRWLVYEGYQGAAAPAPLLGVLGGIISALFRLMGLGLLVANMVLIAATERKQAVHDLAAGTLVVGRSLPFRTSFLFLVGLFLAAGVVILATAFFSFLAAFGP